MTWSPAALARRLVRRATRPGRTGGRRLPQRSKDAWDAGGGRYPVFEPPAIPTGWVTGPPDFVGVGTGRCGSSWWFANIAAHPDVSRAHGALKEQRYFERFADRPFTDADVAGYHRLFPHAPGTRVGEWTPSYMFNTSWLELLRRSAPESRLLVIVRDPVERYWSNVHFGVWWSSERGVAPRPDIWLRRGMYAIGLDNVVSVFDRSQLLVLQYERCRQDTAGELRRTYEFIGLDPDFTPATLETLHAQGSGRPVPPMPAETREVMTEFYRPHVERLVHSWPEIDVSVWPNFKDLA